MIEIKNSSERFIHLFLHTFHYFLIIYFLHFYIFHKEKEDYIENNVNKVLSDTDLYTKFTLQNSDRDKINIIKDCNEIEERDNDIIFYNLFLFLIIFIFSLILIFLASDKYKKQVRRILYESLILFVTTVCIKLLFIYNIRLNYDRSSTKHMYDKIINVLEKNIP